MKQQLAWLCGAALSAVAIAVDVTHAQELDAHALAASGDATADEALGRTVGAFAWDGRLVLRTQSTETVRLAGIELPWPLVAERGFPLALVPVGVVGYAPHIVGGARVYRIYDASLPATFGGGAVDLEPGVLPLVPTLELALGAGVHTGTTFQDGWSYEGGDLDWLSFDDGARALPDSVPSIDAAGRAAEAELLASGPDFSGVWEAERSTPPPDLAFAARAGDRYMLGFGALGIHAAVQLRNAWRSRDEIARDLVQDPSGPVVIGGGEVEQTVHDASLAAALRLRLEYGGGHALEAHTWLARTGEDRVRVNLQPQDPLTGFEEVTTTDLRWRERQVLTQQVRGEQLLGSAGAPVLAWHYALTLASDEEPDRRAHTVRLGFPDQPLDASRRFIARDELSHDLGAELRVPLIASEASALHISAGALAQFRDASYEQRRFAWQATGAGDAASVDALFAPDRAGEAWEPDEFPGVALDSADRTLAGYALIDGRVGVFSAQGGARVEHERLDVEPRNLAAEPGLDFDDLHVAPSARIQIRPSPMLALHTAWSLTVDRPRALEIYPSFVVGDGVFIVGNPELKASRQHNLELGLRFIAEPGQALGADGIALTLVHKRIADPIRIVVVPNGDRSFMNGEYSQLWWLEAQADKHFGFMAPWLSDAYLSCGAAFPLSSREVLGTESMFDTDSFPSIDVPDYIATVRVAYDPARRGGKEGAILALDFQSVGERATSYSPVGFGETISALHSLDLLASYPLGLGFALGLSARNLLDARVERRLADLPVASYRLGRSVMLGVSFREPS